MDLHVHDDNCVGPVANNHLVHVPGDTHKRMLLKMYTRPYS